MIGAVFGIWLAWLAWSAISRGAAGDLLVLAGILIAFPAWHGVARALDRDREATVSPSWLRRQP